MPLRSADEYIASLRDGRTVYFRGARVPDVTTHPVIGAAVRHATIDYRMAGDPAHRDLAVVQGPDDRVHSPYHALPRPPRPAGQTQPKAPPRCRAASWAPSRTGGTILLFRWSVLPASLPCSESR